MFNSTNNKAPVVPIAAALVLGGAFALAMLLKTSDSVEIDCTKSINFSRTACLTADR